MNPPDLFISSHEVTCIGTITETLSRSNPLCVLVKDVIHESLLNCAWALCTLPHSTYMSTWKLTIKLEEKPFWTTPWWNPSPSLQVSIAAHAEKMMEKKFKFVSTLVSQHLRIPLHFAYIATWTLAIPNKKWNRCLLQRTSPPIQRMVYF